VGHRGDLLRGVAGRARFWQGEPASKPLSPPSIRMSIWPSQSVELFTQSLDLLSAGEWPSRPSEGAAMLACLMREAIRSKPHSSTPCLGRRAACHRCERHHAGGAAGLRWPERALTCGARAGCFRSGAAPGRALGWASTAGRATDSAVGHPS
jgi:hypothetical protein